MDVLNRDEIEARLARVLGRDMRSELNTLMDMLGDPPNMANVPYEYWSNGWRDIQKSIEPILIDIFIQQADALIREITIGVDWDLINKNAANWAKEHAEETLRQMFNKRYEHLNETLPRFYEEGWNLGDLRTELERWYSPIRAEMIAITETTRAAVEGERAVVEQMRRELGVNLVPIWNTNNDERVCPICWPRNGLQITDGVYPPAHPNCRCWVTYTVPEMAKQ